MMLLCDFKPTFSAAKGPQMTTTQFFTRIRLSRLRPICSIPILIGATTFASVLMVSEVSASGSWGDATPVEFATGVHSSTPADQLVSVSCASAGNCAATGLFTNASGGTSGMVALSTDGAWSQATPIVFAQGIEATVPFQFTNPVSVSCASVGNCTAVGQFHNASAHYEAFTVSSVNGTWGQASPISFAAGVQDTTPDAALYSVSCASAGNCTAVGQFRNTGGGREVFTVTSAGGVWGQATPIAFASGVQSTTPNPYLFSVSCASAGDCTATGRFRNFAEGQEAFTVTSTGGVWGQATPINFTPGVQSAVPGNDAAGGRSVSCASAGNCTVVGQFRNSSALFEAFTATSTGGTWSPATPVTFASGVQAVGSSQDQLFSVSCASAGDCSAGGEFVNAAANREAFVVSSTGGTWGQATPVTFASGVQAAVHDDVIYSMSCASAGNCTAVGQFLNSSSLFEAFTVSSTGGIWGEAIPVSFASGVKGSSFNDVAFAVSCASAGNCTVVGQFQNRIAQNEAFVVTQGEYSTVTTTTSTTSTTIPADSGSSSVTATPQLPATGSQSRTQLWMGFFAVLSGMAIILRRRKLLN